MKNNQLGPLVRCAEVTGIPSKCGSPSATLTTDDNVRGDVKSACSKTHKNLDDVSRELAISKDKGVGCLMPIRTPTRHKRYRRWKSTRTLKKLPLSGATWNYMCLVGNTTNDGNINRISHYKLTHLISRATGG